MVVRHVSPKRATGTCPVQCSGNCFGLWGRFYRPSSRGFLCKACTVCGSKRPLYSSSEYCMSKKLYGPLQSVPSQNMPYVSYTWYDMPARLYCRKKKIANLFVVAISRRVQYVNMAPRLSSVTPTRTCDATAVDLKSVTKPTSVWHRQTAQRTDILRTQRQHSKQGGMACSFFLFRKLQGNSSDLYAYVCTAGYNYPLRYHTVPDTYHYRLAPNTT